VSPRHTAAAKEKLLTDDCYTLDIRRFRALGLLRPGSLACGRMQLVRPGRLRGALDVDVEVDMCEPDGASVQIEYSAPWRGGGNRLVTEWIALTATYPNFGGTLWWFVCPMSDMRVGCLHLPPNGERFASRQALGLAYRSARESHPARLLRAARAVDAKLGGRGNLASGPPSKPKGMRWTTYDRLRAEWERAALRCAAACAAEFKSEPMDRLVRRIVRDHPEVFPNGRAR